MTEDESYKRKPDYMRGEIEALGTLLSIVASTLDDKQKDYISSVAWGTLEPMHDTARHKDTDPDRDRADGIWATLVQFVNGVDALRGDFEEHEFSK